MRTADYRVVVRLARQVVPGDLLVFAGLRPRTAEMETVRGGVRLHLFSVEVFQANARAEREVHQRRGQVSRVP